MRTRVALALSALSVPALLVTGSGSATAAQQPYIPAGCAESVYATAVGEAVQVFCAGLGEFRTVAACGNLFGSWISAGSLGISDEIPSTAECSGSLLFGAHVVNFWVEQF